MTDQMSENDAGMATWERQPHLKDYFRVVMARRWILISTFTIVVLAALVWVLLQTPIYEAEATILIEPEGTKFTEFEEAYDPTMTQTGGHMARQEFYETQHELLTSRNVLEKTFEQFNFDEERPYSEMVDPIESFGEKFSVSPVRGTRLARVVFQSPDPEMAARVVDYHVEQYLEEYERRTLGVTTGGLQELKEKAEELRPELERKGEELQEFMVEHNMVSMDEAQNLMMSRLMDINERLGDTRQEKIRVQSIVDDVESALEHERSLEDMPEVIDSETIRNLKLEYVRTRQQLEALEGKFGESHPEITSSWAELQTIGERLRQEMSSILATKEAELKRLKAQEKELQRQFNEQQERVLEFNEWAVQYEFMQDDYDSLRKTYRAITERIDEIEVSLAAGSQSNNIFVTAHPEIPQNPAKPQKRLVMLLAVMFGLALGTGLCFFVDYLDTTVKSKEDVARLTDAPVLGYVPAVYTGRESKRPVELSSLDNPRGPLAESFRSIRTALSFADRDEELERCVVTSALPQEGKTMVSVNLAITLALSGRKVLMVDADMRKPRLHKIFGVDATNGVSNLLAGNTEASLTDLARPTDDVENLSLLPCGPTPPNPSELLAGSAIDNLCERAAESYDAIIFDTPPVVNVTDAAALSQHTDGALLVMRTFSTQEDFARRAVERFDKAGSRIRGVILNTVDVPRGGYYGYDPYYKYYQSSYYYYYGEDSDGKGVRRRRRSQTTGGD